MTGGTTRNECEHISGLPVKKLSQPLDQFQHLAVPKRIGGYVNPA
jgi:hypothetical protein